jgi:heptosyltransferase-2
VLASPLLRALRRRFPHAAIDFIVKAEFAPLVQHNPNVNVVHEFNPAEGLAGLLRLGQKLRREHYDAAIDLHKNFRTRFLVRLAGAKRVLRYRKHVWRRWLFVKLKRNTMRHAPPIYKRYLEAASALGARDDAAGTELFWNQQHEQEADRALQQHGAGRGQPLIVLAPGAGYFTKRWPAEHFAGLAARLAAHYPDFLIIILGGQQDSAAGRLIAAAAGNRAIDLTGRCSLLAAAALIKRGRLLVANDSGLMHVAEAVETPLIMLAGSTTRELGFFPQRHSSRVLENKTLACRPCSHLGYEACPAGHFRCLRETTPARVLKEITSMLPGIPAS